MMVAEKLGVESLCTVLSITRIPRDAIFISRMENRASLYLKNALDEEYGHGDARHKQPP